MLADGSRARSAATPARPLSATGCGDPARPRGRDRHRLPHHWRQSGGYRLDRLARDFDLAKLVTGSEGTLVAITEATVGLVELPKARLFAVGHFESMQDAIAATGAALALQPAAVELIDRAILELSRSKLEYRSLADTLEGDPGAAVRHGLRGLQGRGTRAARPPRVGRVPHDRGRDGGRAGRAHQRPQGRARPADGGQRGLAPAARVRRGHGGGARATQRLRRALQGDPRRPRPDRRLVRPRVGRLPAHPPVRRPHGARRDRDDGGGRHRGHGAGGRVRRRELVRARRRPRPQPVQRAHLRRRPVRGDAADEGAVRPAQPPQPGRHGRSGGDHRRPARPGTAAGRPDRDPAVVRRARRHARRGRPLPAHRRLPQDRHRRHVPVLHGHARGGARHARPRQRAGQGALAAGPDNGARRRAAARDPRPVPGVQGVQERVPAQRGHGVAEGRVPLALPGRPRGTAALEAVRLDPAAQPARLGAGAGVEPRAAAPARARGRDRPPPAAAAVHAQHAHPLGCAAARRAPAARSCSWPTRSPRSPSRRWAARRSSCSRRRAMPCGSSQPAAAAARVSPRACSTRRGTWPPT